MIIYINPIVDKTNLIELQVSNAYILVLDSRTPCVTFHFIWQIGVVSSLTLNGLHNHPDVLRVHLTASHNLFGSLSSTESDQIAYPTSSLLIDGVYTQTS